MRIIQTGFVTLTMAAGHFCGSAISPLLVNFMGIYGACMSGATLQVASMCVEPLYYYMGDTTPLIGACAVVFCYFWYVLIHLDISICFVCLHPCF